jgi:lipopolysaccharide transport system permease protein
MLIFTLIFGGFLSVPSGGVPYPLFVYSGLLLWTYLSISLGTSANSLGNNAYMIGKVYFPRLVLPLAPVLSGVLDFAIGAVLLVCMMAYYGIAPTWRLALLPLVMLVAGLLAFAVGTLMASLSVIYRDVRHAFPLVLQVWMFATPIVYPASVVPEQWRSLLVVNPVAGLIGALRAILFGGDFDAPLLLGTVFMTLILSIMALLLFVRMERHLADHV